MSRYVLCGEYRIHSADIYIANIGFEGRFYG